MKTAHNKRIKTKFAHRASLIVNALKRKGAIYLISISFVWVFAPYLHVYWLNSDVPGVFGFKWLTSFLFALALPLTLISGSFFIRYLTQWLPNEVARFCNVLCGLLAASGMFFLLWSFYPMTDDFSWYIYYPLLIVFSVVFGFLGKYIQYYFLSSERFLKLKVDKLTKAIAALIAFITHQRFKAKDLREYESDVEDIMYKIDDLTD